MVLKTKLKLTKEQYGKLNTPEYEWFLRTAYRSQFVTGLTNKQAAYLYGIYNEIFPTKKRSIGCSQCKLEVCMSLGRLFFEYEDELNDMTEEEFEKAADEINESHVKKAPGRPSKKTNNNKTTKTKK